jgi:hypothetical protein
MVLLGVDPHKDTHTVVAVEAGRQPDQITVPARTLGHAELVGWARTRLLLQIDSEERAGIVLRSSPYLRSPVSSATPPVDHDSAIAEARPL